MIGERTARHLALGLLVSCTFFLALLAREVQSLRTDVQNTGAGAQPVIVCNYPPGSKAAGLPQYAGCETAP